MGEGDQTDEVVRPALESAAIAFDKTADDLLDGVEARLPPAARVDKVLLAHAAGAIDDELQRDAFGLHASLLVGLLRPGDGKDDQCNGQAARHRQRDAEPLTPGGLARLQTGDAREADGRAALGIDVRPPDQRNQR